MWRADLVRTSVRMTSAESEKEDGEAEPLHRLTLGQPREALGPAEGSEVAPRTDPRGDDELREIAARARRKSEGVRWSVERERRKREQREDDDLDPPMPEDNETRDWAIGLIDGLYWRGRTPGISRRGWATWTIWPAFTRDWRAPRNWRPRGGGIGSRPSGWWSCFARPSRLSGVP